MAEEVQTVREELEAAFDAAEAAPSPPPPRPARSVSRETTDSNAVPKAEAPAQRPEPESAPERDQTEPDSVDKAEPKGNRPRDQFGRFLSSTPPAPRERAEAQPEEHAQPISDQPETETQEPAPAPAILPPQSWSAAAKDSWHQLPRPIQEEVDRRERDVQRAFQQRAEQTHVLEPIAQALEPYRNKFALRGINPASAIGQLLAVQDILESDPVRGIAYVARSYGVDLRNFAAAYQQAQQPQDPAVRELAERVARQDQMIQSWQQGAEQQEMARITNEVQAFASNTREYPYFEHVRERMAQLMQSGATNTLAQAYRLACADNEQVSRAMQQQAQQAQRSQRQQVEKQAVDRARKAAVSVAGSPYGGAPAKPNGAGGSVRDAIVNAMDQVANQ